MSITLVKSPVLSPSLNEEGVAILTDEHGKHVAVEAIAFADSSGHLGLPNAEIADGATSQVTARQAGAKVACPGGFSIPVKALVGLDGSGNPIPLVVPSAAKVTGKFQSTVLTATGSSQNVAHGLGVVPSLVLVSIQDTNGVALDHVIAEGAHDATNLKLTITANLKFKVIAFA